MPDPSDDSPQPPDVPAIRAWRLEDITIPACYVCDQPAWYWLISPGGDVYRNTAYCDAHADDAVRKLNGAA